jgi:hypothetical protein
MVSKKSLENLKKGKKFGPDNPPRGGGRKKSQLKDFMIKEEFSLSDMKKVFQGIIFTHSVEELNEMVKNDKTLPTPVTALISAFLHDIKHGYLNAMNFIMDRSYGKPVQAAVVEIHDMPDDIKKRMLSIYQEGAAAPVKPKNIMPKKKAKTKREEL